MNIIKITQINNVQIKDKSISTCIIFLSLFELIFVLV